MTLVALEQRSADEPRSALSAQRILAVEFRSGDGRSWIAVGGGATVTAAIASARSACPEHTAWTAVGWNDLYGD